MTDQESRHLHIHLDPVGGAAGDMFVAAMLDAFPDLKDRVLGDIAAVLPETGGCARFDSVMKSGLSAKSLRLERSQEGLPERAGAETTYSAMRDLLQNAPLSEGTGEHACAILHRIAEAEAQVHNIPISRVHFHEIADWDSLMDVTAAGSICAALCDADWSFGPLPTGGGLVSTAHGMLPVPTPATVLIGQGLTWHDDGIAGERITPTGAAILAHVAQRFSGRRRGGVLCASGTGAGTRDLDRIPNILRVSVFEKPPNVPPWDRDQIVQLAADIDDMTGEEIGAAVDHLRAMEGMLDVVLLTGQGKKSRPLTRIECLVTETASDQAARAVFLSTSTLGIRKSHIERFVLPRRIIETCQGVDVKIAQRPEAVQSVKAESEAFSHQPSLHARRRASRQAEETVARLLEKGVDSAP